MIATTLRRAGAAQQRKRARWIVEEEAAVATAAPSTAPRRDGIDLMVAWSIIGLFAIAACAGIYAMETILLPITLAIVVGVVLGRTADGLARYGLPPIFGGLLLAIIFVTGLSWLVNALLGPLTALASEAPKLAESVVARVMPFIDRFEWLRLAVARSVGNDAIADTVMKNAGPMLAATAAGLTPALVQTLIFLAALGLFLLGRLQLRKAVILAFASRERRLSAIRIMNGIEDALARYFSIASVIYFSLGLVTTVIAFVGGLGMAPLWGLFAFVSSKWIDGVMRHGYKGAFEIAATVDYMFAFAATTGAVRDHHFEAAYQAFVVDERVADFLREKNPAAFAELAERLLEAIDRNLWTPRSNSARFELSAIGTAATRRRAGNE
ncbi:AI-2E family transporter [Ensifer adhaerens]|uniref:AI-2E family transporter n=1 Tax=Ensifer adhaerens TaxID=106592 RepID=UPI003D04C1FA